MLYRLIMLSDENDVFRRDIKINTDATFFDLHKAILDACNYTHDQIGSFFICDKNWNKKEEITLFPTECDSAVDNYVMDETTIDQLIDDEGQKLVYEFDMLAERYFYLQVAEIITRQHLDEPEVCRSEGTAPKQLLEIEEVETKPKTKAVQKSSDNYFEDEEEFYGDKDFDIDELGDLDIDDLPIDL